MAVGIKVIGPTALSALTEVLLGATALELPAAAKQILAVVPVISSPAGCTANEPVAGKCKLISDDFKVNPFTCLAQPIGSSLLKSSAQPQGALDQVIYPVNCKITGGSKLSAYGIGLFDHTIEPYMSCAVIFSDQDPTEPQRYMQVGTFTNTGTAATEVVGTDMSLVGGRRLVEVGGFAVGTTVAALKGLMCKLRFTGDDFTPSWDQIVPLNPASGQVDTNIVESIAGVARWKVDIGLNPNKSTIKNYCTLSVALTTTGNFAPMVGYI